MLSTEQKIEEIYQILRKNETRRRRQTFILVIWRLILLAVILAVVFFPWAVFTHLYDAIRPFTEQIMQDMIQSQKENIMNAFSSGSQATYEKALDALQGMNR